MPPKLAKGEGVDEATLHFIFDVIRFSDGLKVNWKEVAATHGISLSHNA